jgi:hypothetical protein
VECLPPAFAWRFTQMVTRRQGSCRLSTSCGKAWVNSFWRRSSLHLTACQQPCSGRYRRVHLSRQTCSSSRMQTSKLQRRRLIAWRNYCCRSHHDLPLTYTVQPADHLLSAASQQPARLRRPELQEEDAEKQQQAAKAARKKQRRQAKADRAASAAAAAAAATAPMTAAAASTAPQRPDLSGCVDGQSAAAGNTLPDPHAWRLCPLTKVCAPAAVTFKQCTDLHNYNEECTTVMCGEGF